MTLHRWGAARPLMIHCALAHGGVLAPLARALGGGLAFDLPGHGKGPSWDAARDYQEQCVAMAVNAMEAPGPVFGHSFGGTVALRLAVERPDLVTALTLVEPVFFAALRVHDSAAYAAHGAAFSPVVEAHGSGDYHLMAERFTSMWGGAPWDGLPQRFKDMLARQMPLIIAQGDGIDADTGDVFAPGRLEALRCPVTLIRGSETQPSVAAIHAVLERLAGAEDHVIAGAGHMSPITHPAEVAALTRL
ncbi:MAG: alpha/beta hydrolase [Pseudomonadota bacterium]